MKHMWSLPQLERYTQWLLARCALYMLSSQDDNRVKQSATALTGPFPWTLWPDAITISEERAVNGNMDDVEGKICDIERHEDHTFLARYFHSKNSRLN